MKILKIVIFVSIPLHLFVMSQALASPAKPNIIFIFADDLGYGDLGSYGQKLIKTPRLDQLASEGMKFTQMYAGSSVCAPTRCALLTGKHMGHASVRHNQRAGDTLAVGESTFGSVLKQVGYSTACIGKWGVGFDPEPDAPNTRGFDYFFGYIDMWHAHNSYPEFLIRNGERVELRNEVKRLETHHKAPLVGYATKKVDFSQDMTTEESIRWIKEQDEPFLLYLPYTVPHENGEAESRDDWIEVPDLGEYADKPWSKNEIGKAALISRMDQQIGEILDTLFKRGIDKNTVVMFTSDNGAGTRWEERFQSNGVLRGGKRQFYEGGIRMPFIVRWPGKVEAGSTSDHICAFWDVMPTLAEIAGAEAPSDIDGISFLPTLLGEGEQKKHDFLYWEMTDPGRFQQSVRWGDWKALKEQRFDRETNEPINETFELYDLNDDISETTNIADANPDIVESIEKMMTQSHVPQKL